MASPTFADIIDAVKVSAVIGKKFLYEAKIPSTNAAQVNPSSNEGTYEWTLFESDFQDVSGQVVAVGGSISPVVKAQTTCKHPKLWRHFAKEFSDVQEDISSKAQQINDGEAARLMKASVNAVDASLGNAVKGIAAALTGNQYDSSSSTIALTSITGTLKKLGDHSPAIKGGIILGHSLPYFKLVDLGLVAITSNTMGIANQDMMVRMGTLPENLLGLTYVMSDKSIYDAYTTNKYYLYIVGPGALALYGNSSPDVEVARLTSNYKKGTAMTALIRYGVGAFGVTYGGTMSELVTDTNLSTAANWTLIESDAKLVPIARAAVSIA